MAKRTKTAQNLVYQSSSALSVVLTHSFWSSCMGKRKNWLFWGLKVTPWLFGFLAPPPPPPLFFSFYFGGNIFCEQTSNDNGISLKEVQVGGGTRFASEFSTQLSTFHVFSHFSLACWGIVWRITTPPPPAQVVSQQTLPMNIKTFDLTTDTRCGWVRITVIPNVFVACEGRGCLYTG